MSNYKEIKDRVPPINAIFILLHAQRSHSRLPSSEESPERRRKEEKHRRPSIHSEGSVTETNEHHELSEDELEKQRAQLLRELQMQQEEN